MIDPRYPLAVRVKRLPCAAIEAAVAPRQAHQARPAKRVALHHGLDLDIALRTPNPSALSAWMVFCSDSSRVDGDAIERDGESAHVVRLSTHRRRPAAAYVRRPAGVTVDLWRIAADAPD
jgi:hypothetical protein